MVHHRLSKHRLYHVWSKMVRRCVYPKDKQYIDYGGRGIKVCEEWKDIRNFIKWVETSGWEEGLTLDRIDNDGNYEHNNCRWTDTLTQVLNQRMRKDNTSGYVGVSWNDRNKKWEVQIQVNKKKINLCKTLTLEEAVEARDNYIISNNLPHKLSKDYVKKEIE